MIPVEGMRSTAVEGGRPWRARMAASAVSVSATSAGRESGIGVPEVAHLFGGGEELVQRAGGGDVAVGEEDDLVCSLEGFAAVGDSEDGGRAVAEWPVVW